MMTKCILCGLEEAGSLEHILPKGLYSGQFPDLFRTRSICNSCNNKNGLYIDGAFLLDPLIATIRSESNIQYMFSKYINSNRVDMYFYQNTYLYVISEIRDEFSTYVNGIPTQRRRNLVFIEIHQNFDLTNFQQYFESIAKIIYKSIGTKNIYFKTPIHINLTVDNQIATEDQLKKYFTQHGIFQFDDLKNDEKQLVNNVFNTFAQELEASGRYNMCMKLDLKVAHREFSKIAYLLGYNLFGQTYIETSCAGKHKEFMYAELIDPASRFFCDNLHHKNLTNTMDKLKHKFDEYEIPRIIIYTVVTNNELRMFVIYGNKYMQRAFCVLISDEFELINEFENHHSDKLFIIKSCSEEHYSKFNNFEELMYNFLTK